VLGTTGQAFQDVRVRRALSMSQDRDQYIDTFNNISQFESSGIKLQTAWHTAIGPLAGWILDPKGKDFGPNAQYFKYDVAETKKLLAAAGYPNGLDVVSSYVGGPERGASYQREPLVTDEFATQAGFRVKTNLVDYNAVYIPKLRDGRGDWEGWAYKGGQPAADGAVAYMVFRYSKAGVGFLGFDANGPAGPSSSGDPQVESMIAKAKTELDIDRQKAIVNELQRYLAGQMYGLPYPGSASKLGLTWPALKNVEVFQYSKRSSHYYWWIDDSQPPLRKA
jgi:ABC-type transport system substrate-binding protein